MSLSAVPTLVIAATLARTPCPVCGGPLTFEGYAPVQGPPDYSCSCCHAPLLPTCDLPPTSVPVPPVPVYCPLPQASAPVPPVVAPTPKDPAIQAPPTVGEYLDGVKVRMREAVDRANARTVAATPAPVAKPLVTFKRMAPVQCYSCKRTIPSGADCTLDAKGRMLHPACVGRSRKAPDKAPDKAPVAKPAAPKVEPPVVTYYEPNAQHNRHVEAWKRCEVARKVGAPAPTVFYDPKPKAPPVAAKPAPAAPIAEPKPAADWLVKSIKYSPDVRYHLWVEGENLSASHPADRAFRWHVGSVKNPRYDLSNAVIDPKAVEYLGRTVEKPAALFAPEAPKPEAAKPAPIAKPVASKPPVPQRTQVDAFMLDDLYRALEDLRSKPEGADDVGKAAEKALSDLETTLDTEEPIADKCIEEAAALLTEYEDPETTVEALRARLDEARTALVSVQEAVTHMVRMIRDAHGEAKSAVEALATLQQRNVETVEDIDVEALVREFEYRGYRIERIKR